MARSIQTLTKRIESRDRKIRRLKYRVAKNKEEIASVKSMNRELANFIKENLRK